MSWASAPDRHAGAATSALWRRHCVAANRSSLSDFKNFVEWLERRKRRREFLSKVAGAGIGDPPEEKVRGKNEAKKILLFCS